MTSVTVPILEKAVEEVWAVTGLPAMPLNSQIRDGLFILLNALPDAFGKDWRFVLRPDAKIITDRLRLALPSLMTYRETLNGLSTSLESQHLESMRYGIDQLIRDSNLRIQLSNPCNESICTRLAIGIEMLRNWHELVNEMSLQYKHNISSTTIHQLQLELRQLQQAAWPLNLLRHKALAKKLKQMATSSGEPDVVLDIDSLVKIDQIRTKIKELDDLALVTSNLWSGLKTDYNIIRVFLSFQTALRQARTRGVWEDSALDFVDQGLCGETAKQDLHRMRELSKIELIIKNLSKLEVETNRIWKGYQTDIILAKAYVSFQEALTHARNEVAWHDDGLSMIESGLAGEALANDLKKMRELKSLQTFLQEYSDLEIITSGLWNYLQTKAGSIELSLHFFETLTVAFSKLATSPDLVSAIKSPILLLLGDSNMLLDPSGVVSRTAVIYSKALQIFNDSLKQFSMLSCLEDECQLAFTELTPCEIAGRASDLLQNSNRLRAWCAWQKVRYKAVSLGLTPIISAIERDSIENGQVKEVFETEYCRWWLHSTVDKDETLRNFVSVEHEKRIQDFRRLDEEFIALTKEWLKARLSANLPSQNNNSYGSEWGILRHEMQKKSRHIPLRELMTKTSEAIFRLAPCLLMSPLSIAQYLSSEISIFDVVIFDEASQIPVWDAIGAMARAKQVIIVGDPMQLPPTNFFGRSESDSNDSDVEIELESILEECIGANLPQIKLAWHYRSRHESLITFSNHRYYNSRLITFPSPMTDDNAVSFKHIVDGQYERGGLRINKPEARALVNELVNQLKSDDFREKGMTAGVVTFNAEQQRLIEDMLDEERRKDPSIESHFLETSLEPVFVKNLESVQGDERDFLYFSITFGPDLSGAMPMNFGPINQKGGERRLNVAITRARQGLIVFSSFRSEQIDLSRTQAVGLRDLKNFLEFSDKGSRVLAESISTGMIDSNNSFEEAVRLALVGKGWLVHSQVGESAFRIDLAVVNPDMPGSYLAAIECDGATYCRINTAKDRDKLRDLVLQGLGWKLIRIWSIDWWIDKQGTLEKIHSHLENLLFAQRSL